MAESTTQSSVRICDCFPALREITQQREDRYLRNPNASVPEGPRTRLQVKVTSVGELNETAESLLTGQQWTISEPDYVGGRNDAPYPLEYLLSGAVGCFAAVFAFYAAKARVNYESLDILAEASLDVRGHMMDDAPPSGFQSVTMEVRVTSNAPMEQIQEVHRKALKGCPGIDTLRSPIPVGSVIRVSRPNECS